MTYTLPEPDCGVHYTAAQMLEAYAAGQRDMREAAAKEGDHWFQINKTHRCGDYIAAAIRALPIQETRHE